MKTTNEKLHFTVSEEVKEVLGGANKQLRLSGGRKLMFKHLDWLIFSVRFKLNNWG